VAPAGNAVSRLPELRRQALNGANSVRLSARALASIAAHAVVSADGCETGGILLGYDESELGEMFVLEAGDPGPNAERRPDFFKRDLAHAQRLADEAFASTSSRWIGEWHTHPGGALAPSRTDLRTYRSFLRDRELGFSVFLALIVGPDQEGWERPRARAWLIEQRRFLQALLLPSAEPMDLTIEPPQQSD
jgi:integrative and conjugative element protein (TIGR02256 family)